MTRPRLLIISFSTITADARLLKQIARLREDFEVHTLGYGDVPAGVVDKATGNFVGVLSTDLCGMWVWCSRRH